ncbi:hypothetical protein ACFSR7_02190 [Cohnella sp. GCM10020058]|uniref:hypothetical protein n=1 Tax=Cohnella sp. GCM10020058 TaxID=3317330 RepID=UPI003642A5D3
MMNTHYRFTDDVMGCPSFNGIRVDACDSYPIRDLTIKNMTYTFVGGVRKEDIPAEYPKVWDMRFDHPLKVSENYDPTWSRTTFMDVRNVERLSLQGLKFHALQEDTRAPYIIENCVIHKEDIIVYS